MLKLFGYGDKLREGFLNKPTDIELLSKNDYRTAYDINRPLKNIYEGVEKLYDFLNVFGDWQLTDEGVFENSLHHEFGITSDDVVKVTLWNKTLPTPTSEDKVYAKLAPGIAGVNYSEDRQDSMIVVHRPNLNLLSRQLEYILGLFYYDESETVQFKWNQELNLVKALIKAKEHPEDPVQNLEFGGAWDGASDGINLIQLLADIYNHDILNHRFVSAIGSDLTQLLVEPIYEIASTGIYYWEIVDGEVTLTTTGTEGFLIGEFEVTDLSTLTVTGITQSHRRYGRDVRLEIFGTADDSYKIITNGGIEYDMAKGLNIHNDAGALIEIDTVGNITINAAPGQNMDFGGVNILGISANTINTTAVFNQDGSMSIDASEAGEVFETDAETHNQTAVTQNNTITTKNDDIGTLDENITGNKTEDVDGTSVETVAGKKTINAQTELEITTPILDENATTKTVNATTSDETVTGTKTETIGTLDENITGNKTEDVSGDSTETVTGTKTETIGALDENINGNKTEDVSGTFVETITGKKTVNAQTELEITTPLLDKNITNETHNVTGTKTDVIGTHDQTITTRDSEVTGNETEVIGGDSTETVTGRKTSTAAEQRISGTTDIVISGPSITLDAGASGTITLIGEQQTVEGTTVQLEDNIIELNKNQTGVPSSGLVSGFEVNRGSETNAQILFRESDDTWVSGLVGALKAIANREDVPTNIAIPYWDSTSKTFKTDSKFTHNPTTGITTINVATPSSQAPIITNSAVKITNLNADKVDGVDINNTGAAANEIAMWTGAGVIGTANKTFVTSISGTSNAEIPTEAAVANHVSSAISTLTTTVNNGFVSDGSISLSALTKGIRLSYTDGSSNATNVDLINLDVDSVDGVDIDNTGAAVDEIAMWIGGTTIGTANKSFVTSINGESDAEIPTEKAVSDYVNDRFVLDGSITLSALTQGIRLTYTDGDGNSTNVDLTNLDVASVDGVSIDNTGAAVDEIVTWAGSAELKTSNKKIVTAVNGTSDTEVPTEKAVVDYFNSRVQFGSGTFNSFSGVTISHSLGVIPTSIQITASDDPDGYMGEVWVANATSTTFDVFCSGTHTGGFYWTAFK